QAQLQLLGQLLGNRTRDEPPKTGVDPVRVLARAVCCALHHLARGRHAPASLVAEAGGLSALDGNCPHVREPEVVAGQRASRSHATHRSPAILGASCPIRSSTSLASWSR